MLPSNVRGMTSAVTTSITGLYRIVIVLVVCLLPTLSQGMVAKMDNTELVARASVVVYGTVAEIHAHNHLQEAVIKVHTVLKGTVPAPAPLRVSFVPSMSESPTFVTGERVLLFLQVSAAGTFQTVGGFQGKLSLD